MKRLLWYFLDVLYPPRDPETGRWQAIPDRQQFAVLGVVAAAIALAILAAR